MDWLRQDKHWVAGLILTKQHSRFFAGLADRGAPYMRYIWNLDVFFIKMSSQDKILWVRIKPLSLSIAFGENHDNVFLGNVES